MNARAVGSCPLRPNWKVIIEQRLEDCVGAGHALGAMLFWGKGNVRL